MEIVEAMGKHRVYDSARKVFSSLRDIQNTLVSIHPDYSNSYIVPISSKNYLHYTSITLKKSNLYVLRTPLISMGTWEALARKVPMCIIEEYFLRNTPKDSVVKMLLFPFRNVPFISFTKRTHAFLNSLKINSFLIPPAVQKSKGAKIRKHILYVGRIEETKNPRLFLKLAKAFPNEVFVMIGKGSMSDQLKKESDMLHNLKFISFLKQRKNLFQYYSEAKLLIHPAIQDPIALVIIEALSTQTPVLASFGAGASDFLPKKWILDPLVESDWINKTKAILEHQKEAISEAEQIFKKEHLDIADPYFEKVSDELLLLLKLRWPELFKKK